MILLPTCRGTFFRSDFSSKNVFRPNMTIFPEKIGILGGDQFCPLTDPLLYGNFTSYLKFQRSL